jgi:hypothetical protein
LRHLKRAGSYSLSATDFNTSNGRMSWYGAMAWSEWLGSINYGGASDWRLWSALNSDGGGPCSGYNCTDSEMGDLFYDEGGLSANADITDSATLTGLFSNMSVYFYWSGTEYADSSHNAWFFDAGYGRQDYHRKRYQFQAWAVRPGQVAAAPPSGQVPLPGTLWLFGAGLLGLSLGRRRWVIRRFK